MVSEYRSVNLGTRGAFYAFLVPLLALSRCKLMVLFVRQPLAACLASHPVRLDVNQSFSLEFRVLTGYYNDGRMLTRRRLEMSYLNGVFGVAMSGQWCWPKAKPRCCNGQQPTTATLATYARYGRVRSNSRRSVGHLVGVGTLRHTRSGAASERLTMAGWALIISGPPSQIGRQVRGLWGMV